MPGFQGFRPAAHRFFRSLARHNERPWFEEHRDLYEAEVRGPMRALIEEMDLRLATVAPELVGDPRRPLLVIPRDIRFSKDKSPYETNAGCWFYHQDAGKAVGQEAESGGAGVYFHLDGNGCFVAGGVWMAARAAAAETRGGRDLDAGAADAGEDPGCGRRGAGQVRGGHRRTGVPAPLRQALRRGDADQAPPRLRPGPPGRAVAPVPVLHRLPAARRAGDGVGPAPRHAGEGRRGDAAVPALAQWGGRVCPEGGEADRVRRNDAKTQRRKGD